MSPEEMFDPIKWPAHYVRNGMEAIDVIEAFAPGNYYRGNALKYLLRADNKGATAQDLGKAKWYIEREIAKLEATPPTDEYANGYEAGATAAMKAVGRGDEEPYPESCAPCIGNLTGKCDRDPVCGHQCEKPPVPSEIAKQWSWNKSDKRWYRY